MRSIAAACLLVLAATPALAQDDQSVEGRLREALRRQTVALRSAQDGQAALQAQLDQSKAQITTLQKQVDDLTAAKAAAPPEPATPSPPPPDPEIEQLRQQVAALQSQTATLQAGLAKWQGAYQQAAATAQAKNAEAQALAARGKTTEARLAAATTANTALIKEAMDILHLYRTQSFRNLLVGSYEPLVGFKAVELQNLVQDYEDKILDNTFYPNAPLPAAPAASAKPPAKP